MSSASIRFHEIDFLRGFACLSVVAFHLLSRGPAGGDMPGADFPLLDALARYGYLGVHLFFLISGFVILMSAQGATPRSFVISRASRLYPALWVGATLTAGAAWLLQDARYMHSLGTYLVNLTMVPHWFDVPYVDGAYWSLAYELHFYILVWLAIRFCLLSRLEWLMAGWLLVSTLNAVRPMWPLEFWLCAKWAPLFTAGGVFFLIRTGGVTRKRLVLLAMSFVLTLVYAVGDAPVRNASAETGGVSRVAVGLIIAAFYMLFACIASARLQMRASPFVFYAGVLTYPLYLVHENLGFMVYGRLYDSIGQASVALALTLVLLVSISWGIYACIERRLGPLLRRWLSLPFARLTQRAA